MEFGASSIELHSFYSKSSLSVAQYISKARKQSSERILIFEIPNGFRKNVINHLKETGINEENIIESPFSFEDINLAAESNFLINFNNQEQFDTINFISDCFLSTYLLYYSAISSAKSTHSKALSYAINFTNSSILKNHFQFLFEVNEQNNQFMHEEMNEKSQLLGRIINDLSSYNFVKEKVKESQFLKIFEIKKEEIQEKLLNLIGLIERVQGLNLLFFTKPEIEKLVENLQKLTISELLEIESFESLISQIMAERDAILLNISFSRDHHEENTLFTTHKQEFYSLYQQNYQESIPRIIELLNNPNVYMIEVPADQRQLISQDLQRITNMNSLRIIESKLNYDQVKLLQDCGCLEKIEEFRHKEQFLSSIIFINNQMWQGKSKEEAINQMLKSLVSRLGYNQFNRFASKLVGKKLLIRVFNDFLDYFMKLLPKSIVEKTASRMFSHQVGGGAASNAFRKFFRLQLVSEGLITSIYVIWDFSKYIRGTLTGSEFVKATIVNGAAAAGATAGASFGMVGGPIGSIFGAVVGGVGGYAAGIIGTQFLPKSDIEKVALFMEERVEYFSPVLAQKDVEWIIDEFRISKLKEFYEQNESLFKQSSSEDIWKNKAWQVLFDVIHYKIKDRKITL